MAFICPPAQFRQQVQIEEARQESPGHMEEFLDKMTHDTLDGNSLRRKRSKALCVDLSNILFAVLAAVMMQRIAVSEAVILSAPRVHNIRACRHCLYGAEVSWRLAPARSPGFRVPRRRRCKLHQSSLDVDGDASEVYTLLIDNYDSYTYNLFQQLALVNGRAPFVVYNDEADGDIWQAIERMGQLPDNIVISPGPGRPDVAADFGMCAQALRTAVDVPILAVCLGHQGLGLAHGAKVVHAREPMHGRLSRVFHSEDPIFWGVPQGARVVRYHSLVVDPTTLPVGGPLKPTAWTVDGELMGIKHETYPHWGVQFHPESVGTEHGVDIVRNFRDLTHEWRRRKEQVSLLPTGIVKGGPEGRSTSGSGYGAWLERRQTEARGAVSTTMPVIDSRKASTPRGNTGSDAVPVCSSKQAPLVLCVQELSVGNPYAEAADGQLASILDPEDVFRALYALEPTAWWLDSSSRRPDLAVDGQGKARFSFMGGTDGPLSHIIECYAGNHLVVDEKGPGRSRRRRTVRANVLDYLKAEMARFGHAGGDVDREGVKVRLARDGVRLGVDEEGDRAEGLLPFDFIGGYVGFLGYELRHGVSDVLSRCSGGTEWHWRAPGGESWENVAFETDYVDDARAQGAGCNGDNDGGDGMVGIQKAGSSAEDNGATLRDNPDVPLGFLVFADRFVAFDHEESKVYVLALAHESASVINGPGTEGNTARESHHNSESEALEWVHHTADALRTKISSLVRAEEIDSKHGGLAKHSNESKVTDEQATGAACSTDVPRSRYRRNVGEIMRLVGEGETYEVCLTNQIVCERPGHGRVSPLDLYARLRRSNPSPYAAYIVHDPHRRLSPGNDGETSACPSGPSFAVCCSSPERFLKVDREGWVESKPIKGTVKRGQTPAKDLALAIELSTGEKNTAENLMIVDLVRNDLGRVCRTGTVSVPKLMHVESYATVHQLVSTIRGHLRPGCGALDAVAAAFPGGSMTGAPKRRTMDIIDRLEKGKPRGVYSGSLGFLSLDGAADLNIVIRTAVVTPKNVTVGAGGAVIALSDIDDEYEEMLLKAMSVIGAISHERRPGIVCPSGSDPSSHSAKSSATGDGSGSPGCSMAPLNGGLIPTLRPLLPEVGAGMRRKVEVCATSKSPAIGSHDKDNNTTIHSEALSGTFDGHGQE